MVSRQNLVQLLAWFIFAVPVCFASGYSAGGGGGVITSFATTAANTMTCGTDFTPLTMHGDGASQTANMLVMDNLPFGGSFIIGPFGQLSTTYDISANRTLTAGQNLVIGPGGGYLAAGSTAATYGVPIVMSTSSIGLHLSQGGNGLLGSDTIGLGGSVTINSTAMDNDDFVILTDTSAVPNAIGEDASARSSTSRKIVGTPGDTFTWIIQKVD